jgi:beta,beta-carotene 9',10'-dioxygenase
MIPSSHSDGFGYFHSFAVTENYIVFLESPLRIVTKESIMAVIKNKPLSDTMKMNHAFPTIIHVINKKTGEVLPQKFVTDPQFSFHHINAFERVESANNIQLCVDISSYSSKHFDINNFTFENMYMGNLMETDKGKALAKRIEIPINLNDKSKKEVPCVLKDINSKFAFEAPAINYWNNNGKSYKYIYGVNHYRRPLSVCKINTENPTEVIETIYSEPNSNLLPSEPVYVQNPESNVEDDGVILVMVLSENNDYLSILDAKNLKEIARADMPNDVRGALTFHGFFAQNEMFKQLNV